MEPSPKNFALLEKKHRKAWTARCGLATEPHPHKVVLQEAYNISQIVGNPSEDTVICQCFPLYSLLAAMGVERVDYLSLDVEGVEGEILTNFPFDKIFVKVTHKMGRIVVAAGKHTMFFAGNIRGILPCPDGQGWSEKVGGEQGLRAGGGVGPACGTGLCE